MNPYAYVGGNPESRTDPTGQYYATSNNGVITNVGYVRKTDSTHVSVFTLNTQTGQVSTWTQTVLPPVKTVPPPHHSGAPLSNITQPKCNDACGKTDRQLIKDHINAEKTRVQNVINLVTDIIAAVSVAVIAILDAITSTWNAFFLDAAEALLRFGAAIVDASKLGAFSLPSFVGSVITILKTVLSIVDNVRVLLDLFNPVGFMSGFLKSFVIQKAGPRLAAGVLEFVAGNIPVLGIAVGEGINIAQYGNELDAVNSLSDEQAHSICLQDYGPGRCL